MSAQRFFWSTSIVLLLFTATTQTIRTRAGNAALVACQEHLILVSAESRALKPLALEAAARDLNEDLSLPSPWPENRVYMIVNTRCSACRRAVEEAEERGTMVPMYVTSFREAPSEIESWLVSLGSKLPVMAEPIEETFLRHLPRTVTPLFLEFHAGKPVDLVVGTLKESWFDPTGR